MLVLRIIVVPGLSYNFSSFPPTSIVTEAFDLLFKPVKKPENSGHRVER
jgi:hypothetical protein